MDASKLSTSKKLTRNEKQQSNYGEREKIWEVCYSPKWHSDGSGFSEENKCDVYTRIIVVCDFLFCFSFYFHAFLHFTRIFNEFKLLFLSQHFQLHSSQPIQNFCLIISLGFEHWLLLLFIIVVVVAVRYLLHREFYYRTKVLLATITFHESIEFVGVLIYTIQTKENAW